MARSMIVGISYSTISAASLRSPSPLRSFEPAQMFGHQPRQLHPSSARKAKVFRHHLQPVFQLLVPSHFLTPSPVAKDRKPPLSPVHLTMLGIKFLMPEIGSSGLMSAAQRV